MDDGRHRRRCARSNRSSRTYNDDPTNIRNQADIGGGGLMDIGCYNISLSRFIFGAEPQRVCGIVEYDPQFKTDRLASGMLDFGRGTATFTCSTQLAQLPARAISSAPPAGSRSRFPSTRRPTGPAGSGTSTTASTEEIVFDICDQYTIQGDVLSRAILDDTPVPTPIEDAVANMAVIEAIVRSAKSGAWV